jgi:hypothetical protein
VKHSKYVRMSQDPKESDKGICYTFFVLSMLVAVYDVERLWVFHVRSSGPRIGSLDRGPFTVTEEF